MAFVNAGDDWTKDWQRRALSLLGDDLADSPLAGVEDEFLELMREGLAHVRMHGDFSRWLSTWEDLPRVDGVRVCLDADHVRVDAVDSLPQEALLRLQAALQGLHPWRKGPFSLFGLTIDTEWRSDWKWERLAGHIAPLQGRVVLDVGCGCGYHLWRMRGAGASLALGIDPTALFFFQFWVLKQYLAREPVHVLPVGIEAMPGGLRAFDTVFSMGVLYHRRSPMDHLLQLRGLLRSGGELVLETLYVEGDAQACLLPPGRYAKMRNVWFLPSIPMLQAMLRRAGFRHIRCVHAAATDVQEQRKTPWMRFESLADFLDPKDRTRTIEGHPAPRRAILLAEA